MYALLNELREASDGEATNLYAQAHAAITALIAENEGLLVNRADLPGSRDVAGTVQRSRSQESMARPLIEEDDVETSWPRASAETAPALVLDETTGALIRFED